MKLTFEKKELANAIQILQNVSAGRTTLPVLGNVLVKADEHIEMAGTDLEVSINMDVEGSIAEPGSITIPAKKLSEIVRELPDEEIEINTTSNDRIEIRCGEGEYKMIGLPSSEFPEIPSTLENYFTIKADSLTEMIEKTEFAAATDESRYFLNGVFFRFSSEETKLVATDSRRLAMVEGKVIESLSSEIGVIVPLKAVKSVQKAFAKDDEVKIGLLDNQIVFSTEDTMLVSRLIEGDYPNYEEVIPKDNETEIRLDTKEFLNVLQRVALLSNPKTYSIKVNFEGSNIMVSARTPELGEAQEDFEANSGEGNLSVSFDSRYIIDALKHVDTQEVVLNLKDSLAAVLIHPFENSDTDDERVASDELSAGQSVGTSSLDYIYLIMPMRSD